MNTYFIKQFTGNKSFLFSVVALYLFLFWGASEDIKGSVDVLLLFQISTELGVALLLRPFIAALPISFFLMHEWGTHYYQTTLSRVDSVKYALSKVISTYLVGFLVPFLSCILLIITIFLFSPSQVLDISLDSSRNLFPSLLTEGYQGLALFLYITGFSLAGAIWSVIILGISLFTTNAYILIAAPFLLERVSSYVFQFISLNYPFILCFDTSQNYALCIDFGLIIQLVYSVFLAAIVYFLILWAIKRRRYNG